MSDVILFDLSVNPGRSVPLSVIRVEPVALSVTQVRQQQLSVNRAEPKVLSVARVHSANVEL